MDFILEFFLRILVFKLLFILFLNSMEILILKVSVLFDIMESEEANVKSEVM